MRRSELRHKIGEQCHSNRNPSVWSSCVFWQDEAFSREPGEGGRREAPTYRNDGSRFVVPDAIR